MLFVVVGNGCLYMDLLSGRHQYVATFLDAALATSHRSIRHADQGSHVAVCHLMLQPFVALLQDPEGNSSVAQLCAVGGASTRV